MRWRTVVIFDGPVGSFMSSPPRLILFTPLHALAGRGVQDATTSVSLTKMLLTALVQLMPKKSVYLLSIK
jgi:hypothetical protein